MEQQALRLESTDAWTWIVGDDEAKKAAEVVLRSFDEDVLFATGESRDAPTSEPVVVPAGEGRRLTGKHFFVKPANEKPCRVSYRGL